MKQIIRTASLTIIGQAVLLGFDVLGFGPGGIIGLATNRLIGADADVILLFGLQLRNLLGSFLIILYLYLLFILFKILVGRNLDLIAGDALGRHLSILLLPFNRDCFFAGDRFLERRSFRINRKVQFLLAAVFSFVGDGYGVGADILSSLRPADRIIRLFF